MRVVSLVPSVTETLFAWGVEPVAGTRFCDRPGLRVVGGTKDPDLERVMALEPDLVVMDEEENRREDFEALVARGVEVLALAVRDLADVAPEMARLARAVGATLDQPVMAAAPAASERAAVPIWRRPWRFLGLDTYGASLLARAGFEVVPADRGRYPALELTSVAALRPDHVIAPSEPYPFGQRHRPELETVAPVLFVDGRDLFWWGARTAGALQRVVALLA